VCESGLDVICHSLGLDRNFFLALEEEDKKIVCQAATSCCRSCGGPLYRSDYDRKPRGGSIAAAGEVFRRRFSLCCGRDGCRRRYTPPSVRFLGRRVYLGVAVLVASALATLVQQAAAVQQVTAIPARTVRRWRTWWQTAFVVSSVFVHLAARLLPRPDTAALPWSLLDRLTGTMAERLKTAMRLLGPQTTRAEVAESLFSRSG
jgi:hypothetical protein